MTVALAFPLPPRFLLRKLTLPDPPPIPSRDKQCTQFSQRQFLALALPLYVGHSRGRTRQFHSRVVR